MTLLKLFETLRERGVKLNLDEHDNLSLVGRRESLDGELLGVLKENKSQIVEWLKQEQHTAHQPIIALPRKSDHVPASFAQQRLWFVDQLGGGSPQYNMPGAMRVSGIFNDDVAERALARIVARHEPLRTVFVDGEMGLQQWIRDEVDFRLRRIDLQHLSGKVQEAAVADIVSRDGATVFDLSHDLMLRASVLRLAPDAAVFVFNMHHIASDGWSMGILVREFFALYEAIAHARPDPLPRLTVQYADYAQWQRRLLAGNVVERRLAYWETQLAGIPALHTLPLDRPRPAVQTFNGAAHEFTLAPDTLAGLKQLALANQATLFMVLQAAFALLLSRHSGSSDIVIGTPVANRMQKELEPLVGLFVNTLVLRADCSAGQSFREFLARLRKVNLDAQTNQDVPFEYLIERLKPARNASHSPLFQITFNMSAIAADAAETTSLRFTPLEGAQVTAKFELTLNAIEAADGLLLIFEYNRDLFEASTMARLSDHLGVMAGRIVADPNLEIGALTRSGGDMAAARDYWRGYLREVESPTPLSIDKLPAEAVRQHRFIELTLSIDATTQLQELARRSHTTLYTVLQCAWGLLLHKYSGESTVVFGAILSGRPAELVDVERMVGLFINTLPVKVVVDMTQRIDEALGELHRAFQQSAEFGYLPLADIRRQTGLPAGAALFDSLLVLENYPLDEAIGAESHASLALSGVDAFDETDYKLTLNASLSDRLRIRCSYHSDTFGERVIERLLGHLESILTQLPTRELSAQIELLAPQERQALEQWRTAEQSDGQLCIHRRFEQRAQSTPDAIALACEDETLSYAELNTRANRLAHALRAQGVQAETLVGLCVERGVQMMVGILGILKAGGAYVPFDPATPRARLAYMLEDSAIGIVVSEAAALDVLPDSIDELVLLDDPSLAHHSGDDLAITAVDAGPTSAAYVIYTSGSTGKPKGVLVEHRHVDRLFTVTDRHFGFTDRDVWTLFHSYAFDFSVWEMWGALFYGGKLVIVPKLVARSPELFHQLVAQSGVTVLNQTPAAFELFARVDEQANTPLSLRYVIFGGAALDYYTLQPWMERHPESPRMINMYGITETTVHVTFREVTRADVAHGRGSMIGWPLADLTAVVLDAQGRQLPIGVAGELYVGGAGVSRGYLNRSELTAERFIDVAGATLYRTGDLVRRHESGELEYLGRIDNQVKIRGFRIELGEIESELNRVDLVRESLVLAQGEATDKRLIAYVVANETTRECSDRIRAALSQVLPDYMVPAVIMVIAAFPLNINGKVDRAALPPPDAGVSAGGWTAPRNETQRRMVAIWQEVLGLARAGIDDNFFAVGGDSIRAIPLISRFKKAGFALSIKDLFEAPTIALLSERTDGACQEAAMVELAPFALVDTNALEALGYRLDDGSLHDAYPMTALQQGMVFHNLLSADRTAYHDVMSFHVRTPWDAPKFEQTLQLLVDRHEMLRTAFHLDGETPLQLVLARHLPELEVIDLRHLDFAAQEGEITEAAKTERSSEFDYAQPPWRMAIHLRSEGEFQYTLSFHHAILDGWSVANFNTQLFNAYLRESQAAAVVPQHLPFRHYVQMELEASQDPSVRTAWREKFEGVELPWWAGKRKRKTLNGIQRLQPSVSQGLVDLAQRLGVQERSVLLTAHVVLMALLDGRTDVVTSVVANGRPEREGADLTIGLFINSLPFRVQVQDETWAQLVRRVDREVAAYYAIRHLPLSEIQAECGLDFSASLFNYINFHVYHSLDERLDVLGAQEEEEKNYAISLSFAKAIGTQGPQFDLRIDVDISLFPEPFFRRIEGYLRRIVAHMAADGDAQVSLDDLLGAEERDTQLRVWNDTAAGYHDGAVHRLPMAADGDAQVSLDDLLGADERDTQLHAWNGNSAGYHDGAVHRWFEAQVEKTPNAVAVTYRGMQIDYAELNLRANQVAHALVARGTTAGQRVGLCVENSIEMLVGILAILKTGAAYVPLDPAHPRDRIRQVVEDSGIQVLLTQRHLQASLDDADTVTLALDVPDWYEGLPQDNAEATADVSTLAPAYVVYTSGSTGRPRGVVVGHRALAIYLSHALATYHAPHLGGSLVATSFAFDLTKPALFLPLLSGGRVELLDAADTLGDLTRRAVDVASGDRLIRATPMHVQAMLDLLPAQAASQARHAFVIGGEAFSPALATSLQARFPRSVIHNHYGPSEAVVGCAMYDVSANIDELGDTLPIGRGMANTALYVLNERLQPSPIGVPGILHVAGDGLADGYLGQPELTRAAFLDNPFAGGSLARMYRTGDRVRYGEDGNLLFLGRADDQVKLRGFRIELGEIDALVRQLPFVKEAVVVAKGTGADKALVAYVVVHPETDVDEGIGDAVKTALRGRLPDYMVPAAIVCLPALPLSSNGKIDRRRLPDPDWSAGKTFVAPEGEFEIRLTRIWADILGAEAVGATDNFFDLGGHSLKATRLVNAISREFAIALPLVQVFQTPFLRAMAKQIEQQCVIDENRAALDSMPQTTEVEW